jgi:hypothetical protein
MTNVDSDAPAAKLPLDDAIRASYVDFFQAFGDLLRMSWLCLLIFAVLSGLLFWIDMNWPEEGFAPPPPRHPALVITTTGMKLLLVIAATSIAVAWHRRILLGEQPGFSGGNIATRALWCTIMVEIALAAIALMLPYAIVVSIIYLAGPNLNIHQDSFALVLLLFVALFITGIAVLLRFVLLLPARAVSNNKLTFARAWRLTHGNFWRLTLGLAACALPPILALRAIKFLLIEAAWSPRTMLSATDIPDEAFFMVIDSVILAGYLLTLQISTGFLSQAYRHLIEADRIGA